MNCVCTEQKPLHRIRRASGAKQAAFTRSGSPVRHSHSAMRSSGTPIARAVLRPRCWSGKKKTRGWRSQAHSSTARAFDEVHTTPPRAPQNALSPAVEFM